MYYFEQTFIFSLTNEKKIIHGDPSLKTAAETEIKGKLLQQCIGNDLYEAHQSTDKFEGFSHHSAADT